MKSSKAMATAPLEQVTQAIRILRGQKVLLDEDLATLYGVTTRRFNEQLRRNLPRFPADFMFRLTDQEVANLRSHFATSSLAIGRRTWGGRRYAPYAFTELGAMMTANILNSPHAVEMSVYIVRAFIRLREILASNQELAQRLDELDARITKKLGACDQTIAEMFEIIRKLMNPSQTTVRPRPIGFTADIDP